MLTGADDVLLCLYVFQQWGYSNRQRDRGGHRVPDLIDIDDNHEDQFEVDGSGDAWDDDDGDDEVQSGDDDEASGGI